jgi:hypothetical protein
LTLISRGASSTANVAAALAAIATEGPTTGVDASALPVTITDAPSERWSKAAWTVKKTALKFRSVAVSPHRLVVVVGGCSGTPQALHPEWRGREGL